MKLIDNVIRKGAQAVTDYLKSQAQTIGIDPDVIVRTYNPEAVKNTLTDAAPFKIAVYVSDADPDEITDMAVAGKQISVSIAIVKKLTSTSISEIDAVAELFETVQNLLVVAQVINALGEQGFQLTKPETGAYCDMDTLRDARVALFIIHLDLQAYVAANFQTVTTE